MSSSGYRKPSIGSHWRRPKHKIYECNYREHERAYQDSYKDYSDTKQYIRENQTSWAEKEAAIRQELDNIHKYGTRKAECLTPRRYTTPDNPLILKRANSTIAVQEANAEGSYVRSRLEASKEKNYLTDSSARKSATTTSASEERSVRSSARASSLPKPTSAYDLSQDEEMANIEMRLQKLRKLREELGLPSEAGSDPAPEPVSSRGRELKAAMSSSSARSSSKSRAMETEDYSSSSRSARSTGTSSSMTNGRSSLSRDDTDEYKPTRRSARATAAAAAAASNSSSKMSNGRSSISREEKETRFSSIEPSPRASRRKAADDYESSVTSKSSMKSSKSSATSASSKIINDIDDYDDDMLLPDIRKKLPSSQEILDRIKNMDL